MMDGRERDEVGASSVSTIQRIVDRNGDGDIDMEELRCARQPRLR